MCSHPILVLVRDDDPSMSGVVSVTSGSDGGQTLVVHVSSAAVIELASLFYLIGGGS